MKNKKAAPNVIHYLRMMSQIRGKPPKGFAYNGIEDLILKHGEVFVPAPLPPDIKKGRMKMCFKNSAGAALSLDGGWEYTEGVALSKGLIPVQHAWLSYDGRAFDPTWTDGVEYVGVVFDKALLSTILLATKHYGVLEDWRNNYPILRNKFNPAQLKNFYSEIVKKG